MLAKRSERGGALCWSRRIDPAGQANSRICTVPISIGSKRSSPISIEQKASPSKARPRSQGEEHASLWRWRGQQTSPLVWQKLKRQHHSSLWLLETKERTSHFGSGIQNCRSCQPTRYTHDMTGYVLICTMIGVTHIQRNNRLCLIKSVVHIR